MNTQRILASESPGLASAINGFIWQIAPAVGDLHAAAKALGFDITLADAIASPHGAEVAYRRHLIASTPILKALPLKEEALMPSLEMPLAWDAFAAAANMACMFAEQSPIAFALVAPVFIEGKPDPARVEELVDSQTRKYITDPDRIALHSRLAKLVADLNAVQDILGSGLFGGVQLRGAIAHEFGLELHKRIILDAARLV